MKILAIETSCDDTGIAVLRVKGLGEFNILSNIVASQIEIHKQYGGVFPAMAKREHQKNLAPATIEALRQSGLLTEKKSSLSEKQIKVLEKIFEKEKELFKFTKDFLQNYAKPEIDLIAVTNGPGLEPCLWTGVNFAKALSFVWGKKIIAINHIESHILVNYLNNPEIKLPALALVVSGGHTQLILVKKSLFAGFKYKILGETRDDAAGECFDKCAKILGLGYPGGPEISKLANGITADNVFPRPMANTKDYDFSFSGLKTAVLYYLQKNPDADKNKMAAEVQQAILDVLIKKTIKAAKDCNVKTIILGGGVSANKELKKQLEEKINSEIPGAKFLFPQIDHSTDNGLMTAITGWFHRNKKTAWKKLQANANLRVG